VKTLSGIGVSAGALRYMSKETLAQLTDDPKDRVPRLYGWKLKNPGEYNGRSRLENPPEREPEYYTIPRDKWVRVQTAHNAAEKLSRLLQEEYYSEGHSGIIDPAVTAITRGQKPQKAVVANYIREIGTNDRIISEPTITKEELEELVPDEMSGKAGQGKYSETVESIPVTVDVIKHKLTGGCNQYDCASGDYFDYKYEDSDGDHVVPSGCQMNVLNSGGGPCTTGVRAWDGEKLVMITAGHCTLMTMAQKTLATVRGD